MTIRRLGTSDEFAYEIWDNLAKPAPNPRGSVHWEPRDPDHPEYLYLVMKVLGDRYANLSEQGEWQE